MGQGAITLESDVSNLDPAACDVSLGNNLFEADWSQPTPYNSVETSPVPQAAHSQDDSVVELAASQDELDELDKDESTELSMATLPESHLLKHQLHEKHKQVKKVEKQAKIQELQSQLAETDQQFDLLRWKASAQPTLGKGACQPAATSTPQIVTQQDQSWLQQADIDAADVFLNQLDDTLAKGADSQN